MVWVDVKCAEMRLGSNGNFNVCGGGLGAREGVEVLGGGFGGGVEVVHGGLARGYVVAWGRKG